MSTTTAGAYQKIIQYHAYWGQYVWNAGAVNTFDGRTSDVGSTNLPNAPGNPLAAPFFQKLQSGDTASTTEASADGSQIGLWVCIYPGAAPGDGLAVWARSDNAHTIRDAHVIVVGQSGWLAGLANAGQPPLPANNLDLSLATGDVASVTCDYLDAGDGAEFEQALLAAAASGSPIDVRLRPCDIELTGTTTVPVTLPAGCRLIGAGMHVSTIASRSAVGDDQSTLIVEAEAECIDVGFVSPKVTGGAPGGTNTFVVSAGGAYTRFKNCYFELDGAARVAYVALLDATATALVMDCSFLGEDQTSNATPGTAVWMGDPSGSFVTPDHDFVVRGCTFDTWNRLLFVYEATRGSMYDCEGIVVRPNDGAIGVTWTGTGGGGGDPTVRVDNVRVYVSPTEAGGDTAYYGILLTQNRGSDTMEALQFSGVQVIFLAGGTTVPRYGYSINAGSSGVLQGMTLVGGSVFGHTIGIAVNANGGGTVEDGSIAAVALGTPTTLGGVPGTQIRLQQGGGLLSTFGVYNCAARNAPAGGYGIDLEAATPSLLKNTIVVGNNIVPSGGTAFRDQGTGTEAGHNIES